LTTSEWAPTLHSSGVDLYRVVDGRHAQTCQMVDGLAFYRLAGLLPEQQK